jgi:hypothetical protein
VVYILPVCKLETKSISRLCSVEKIPRSDLKLVWVELRLPVVFNHSSFIQVISQTMIQTEYFENLLVVGKLVFVLVAYNSTFRLLASLLLSFVNIVNVFVRQYKSLFKLMPLYLLFIVDCTFWPEFSSSCTLLQKFHKSHISVREVLQ